MQTYIFHVTSRTNDRNGNPRNLISVYRVKHNKPHLLGDPQQDIGYRGDEQAACDIILDNEPGWSKKLTHRAGSGLSYNAVSWAIAQTRYNYDDKPASKKAQIFSI